MTIVDTVTEIMGWLSSSVAPLVSLKLQPDGWGEEGLADDRDYQFETVHPGVFGMYWPSSKEALPPGVRDVQPGMLVQVVSGTEDYSSSTSDLTVRIHLSAWNPGRHGCDVWDPNGPGADHGFSRRDDHDFAPVYDDGWRDAWNLLDTLLRELRGVKRFGEARLDRAQPVTFGPYSDQGDVVDLYPYWFCYVEFHVKGGRPAPVTPGLADLL